MKKLFKVALVAVFMVFAGSIAKAQTKIGHINFNQLVEAMPEMKTIRTQMDAYQKTFVDQLTTMNTEYQGKVQDYEAKRTTMTDATRTAKESELTDMQKRITDYQNNARQQVEAKSSEFTKPLIDKATSAISAVAKEKGYAYVLDSSQTTLIVSPEGDNLLAPVKAKLGLAATAAKK